MGLSVNSRAGLAAGVRRGNVELVRFSELELSGKYLELHSHSTFTDGRNSVSEMVARASELGITAYALTEHVRRDTDWFGTFAAEVRRVSDEYPDMALYVGCESKVMNLDGEMDVSEVVLGECDLFLGSVHRFPSPDGGLLAFQDVPKDEFAQMEYGLALAMIQNSEIDVWAHPGGMYERHHGAFPRERMRELVWACRERDVAVEINSTYLRDFAGFLELLEEANPFVSCGSDAHGVDALGICGGKLRTRRETGG